MKLDKLMSQCYRPYVTHFIKLPHVINGNYEVRGEDNYPLAWRKLVIEQQLKLGFLLHCLVLFSFTKPVPT